MDNTNQQQTQTEEFKREKKFLEFPVTINISTFVIELAYEN